MSILLRPPHNIQPRWLHPVAWWSWGIAGAVCAMLTKTITVHLALLIAIFLVVLHRRPAASWSGSFSALIRLALFIISFRLIVEIVFGISFGGTVLFTIPSLPLPDFLAGLRLGGPVSLEGLIAAFEHGFQLSVILICAAAPTTLVPPSRLLKVLPAAIYETGVVAVIALGFLPALASDARRIRTAAQLRGRDISGIKGRSQLLRPLLDSALNRSVSLATSMESRGFGKSQDLSSKFRWVSNFMLLSGLAFLLIGSITSLASNYALIAGFELAAASLLIGAAVWISGRRRIRTSYKSDPWKAPEWAVLIVSFGSVLVTHSFINSSALPIALLVLMSSPAWFSPRVPIGVSDD